MKQLTQLDIDSVHDIMRMQDKLKDRQDEVKEAVKALADRLESSSGRITNIIKLVRKEQRQPGTIVFEQELLDQAEKVAR